MTELTAQATAPGKVNVFLSVGDVREDGYHDLVTVFQALNLQETVMLTTPATREELLAATKLELSLSVTGLDAHLVPTDASNLAWRAVVGVWDRFIAARGGAAAAPAPAPVAAAAAPAVVPVHIAIAKRVPVAGGMAGGSADAAAALKAAHSLFFDTALGNAAGCPPEELRQLAAALGADVPFCLLGGTALGRGRGDELVPVLTRGTYHWVIATNKHGLSTPEVFSTLDDLRARRQGQNPAPIDLEDHLAAVLSALASGDARAVAVTLRNDLQAAAVTLRPDLRNTLLAAERAGALAAIVSGSGPSVAILCESADHAEDVAEEISLSGTSSQAFVVSS